MWVRDKILIEISTNPKYIGACKTICSHRNKIDLHEDLFQHVLIILIEIPSDKLIQLYQANQLQWYFVKLCLNQLQGKRSEFNKLYKSQELKEELSGNEVDEDSYDFDFDIKEECVNKALEQMHWYKRDLFKLYKECRSYRKLSKETKIPVTSIQLTIKEVQNDIINYYNSLNGNLS